MRHLFPSVQSVQSFILGYLLNLKIDPGEFQVHNDPVQVKRFDNGFYHNGMYDLNLGVRFRLWTRENPFFAQEILVWDRRSLYSSTFDNRRLTKIFLHGANHRSNERRLDRETAYLRDAYTTFADVNFILMDWTYLAMHMNILTNNGDIAAERLAQFLIFLNRHGTPLESIHIIGHSWGAHVAGKAGKKLKGRIGRITGLDPAGPFYMKPFNIDPKRRLDKNDAHFVDIIHVNGGRLLSRKEAFLGTPETIGHVDFFPSGGKNQPSCPSKTPSTAKDFYCSHERGIYYFAESIGTPFSFPGCSCESWEAFSRNQCECNGDAIAFMGEHCSRTTPKGTYFLNVHNNGGHYGFGPQIQVILKSITKAPTFIQTETRSTLALSQISVYKPTTSHNNNGSYSENVRIFDIPSYSSKYYDKVYRDDVINNLFASLANFTTKPI